LCVGVKLGPSSKMKEYRLRRILGPKREEVTCENGSE